MRSGFTARKRVVGAAELVGHAGPEVLHHNVGSGHNAAQYVAVGVGGEIEGEGPFAVVPCCERLAEGTERDHRSAARS